MVLLVVSLLNPLFLGSLKNMHAQNLLVASLDFQEQALAAFYTSVGCDSGSGKPGVSFCPSGWFCNLWGPKKVP